MHKILIALLLFCSVVFAIGPKDGKLDGDTYSNSYYRLKCQLPAGWKPLSEDVGLKLSGFAGRTDKRVLLAAAPAGEAQKGFLLLSSEQIANGTDEHSYLGKVEKMPGFHPVGDTSGQTGLVKRVFSNEKNPPMYFVMLLNRSEDDMLRFWFAGPNREELEKAAESLHVTIAPDWSAADWDAENQPISAEGKPLPPLRVRVSQGVSEGLLIHKVMPSYPAEARAGRIQGSVVLKGIIGRDGNMKAL